MTDERTRRIQERAHSIWEREGRFHGRDAQHWSQAEQEIDAEDAESASSPAKTTAARRQPKRRAGAKTVADTSGASLDQATYTTAEVSTEEPVKTQSGKPKALTEDGSEAPKARRGRSSKVAAEASADAPVKTRGRTPKAVAEGGAKAPKAPKAPRGRKANAVAEDRPLSSAAAGEAELEATIVEEGTEVNAEAAQDAKLPEEPGEAAEASRTDE